MKMISYLAIAGMIAAITCIGVANSNNTAVDQSDHAARLATAGLEASDSDQRANIKERDLGSLLMAWWIHYDRYSTEHMKATTAGVIMFFLFLSIFAAAKRAASNKAAQSATARKLASGEPQRSERL